MQFPFPCHPASFELLDAWLAEAGAVGFTATAQAFATTDRATDVVPLTNIEPPFRLRGYPKDFEGFDRARMVRILAGIVAGDAICPPKAIRLPRYEFMPSPFGFRIWDGLHRFYASIAMGFTHLPIHDATIADAQRVEDGAG